MLSPLASAERKEVEEGGQKKERRKSDIKKGKKREGKPRQTCVLQQTNSDRQTDGHSGPGGFSQTSIANIAVI